MILGKKLKLFFNIDFHFLSFFSSICRRRKCVCKTGFQIEIRNQNESFHNNQSILLNKLIPSSSDSSFNLLASNLPSTNSSNATRLICEPILSLNLDLNHHHNNRLNEKQTLKNNSAIYQQLNRSSSNVQMIKNFLNKNCTDELIICEGRHNCIKKSKRLHVQENFASLGECVFHLVKLNYDKIQKKIKSILFFFQNLVWTVLCMLSIILVLCMLLIKNKQDDNLDLNHNYNNYFLRNTSVNNLNNQTTTFLGIRMFNRSHLNSANATELQNINERSLICEYQLLIKIHHF